MKRIVKIGNNEGYKPHYRLEVKKWWSWSWKNVFNDYKLSKVAQRYMEVD